MPVNDGSIQTLRLQLEIGSMKTHVVQMVADHSRELESEIERQLLAIREEFDFALEVRRNLKPLIQAEVRRIVTAKARERADALVQKALAAAFEEEE